MPRVQSTRRYVPVTSCVISSALLPPQISSGVVSTGVRPIDRHHFAALHQAPRSLIPSFSSRVHRSSSDPTHPRALLLAAAHSRPHRRAAHPRHHATENRTYSRGGQCVCSLPDPRHFNVTLLPRRVRAEAQPANHATHQPSVLAAPPSRNLPLRSFRRETLRSASDSFQHS